MTDDLPEIAVAPADAPQPPQAKRGRGRPPALNPDGSRKHPPARGRRGDRAPKRERTATERTSQPRTVARKTRIADALADVSGIMTIFPPTSRDALSARENEMLADALDKECRRNARMAKAVDRALAAKGTAGIVGVVAIIGARRAARHKLIGPYSVVADAALGQLIHDDGTPGNPIVAALASQDFAESILARAREVEGVRDTVVSEESVPDVPLGAPAPPVEQPTNNSTSFSFEDIERVSYPVT